MGAGRAAGGDSRRCGICRGSVPAAAGVAPRRGPTGRGRGAALHASRLRGHGGAAEGELAQLAPHPVGALLVEREAGAGPLGLVVGQLLVGAVHRRFLDTVRHRDVRVVRELQFARHRPGGVADPLLQPGAGRGALDHLDEDHGRQRAEGPGAGQPHREGPAARRHLRQVRLDRGQRGAVDLGRRQQGDVRGDAVSSGVAEPARAAAGACCREAPGPRSTRRSLRSPRRLLSLRVTRRMSLCRTPGYRLYGHDRARGRRNRSDVQRYGGVPGRVRC